MHRRLRNKSTITTSASYIYLIYARKMTLQTVPSESIANVDQPGDVQCQKLLEIRYSTYLSGVDYQSRFSLECEINRGIGRMVCKAM